MLALAEQAGVSKPEAAAVIDEVQAAISRWHDFAAQAGVSQSGTRQIAQSLPPGVL
jgi:hypothetical protein